MSKCTLANPFKLACFDAKAWNTSLTFASKFLSPGHRGSSPRLLFNLRPFATALSKGTSSQDSIDWSLNCSLRYLLYRASLRNRLIAFRAAPQGRFLMGKLLRSNSVWRSNQCWNLFELDFGTRARDIWARKSCDARKTPFPCPRNADGPTAVKATLRWSVFIKSFGFIFTGRWDAGNSPAFSRRTQPIC